jgi:hypothetical protein
LPQRVEDRTQTGDARACGLRPAACSTRLENALELEVEMTSLEVGATSLEVGGLPLEVWIALEVRPRDFETRAAGCGPKFAAAR